MSLQWIFQLLVFMLVEPTTQLRHIDISADFKKQITITDTIRSSQKITFLVLFICKQITHIIFDGTTTGCSCNKTEGSNKKRSC